MNILEIAKKYEQYIIDMRRHFHMNPEPSMQEYETSKRVQEELDKMGVEYVDAATASAYWLQSRVLSLVRPFC